MFNTTSSRFARSSLAAAALAATALTAVPAHAELLVGLTTTNALLTFDSSSPMNGSMLASITGLMSANERILGIDLRPATGMIFGLSTDSKLYSLNATSGAATFVSTLSTSLSGTSFGVDFNPTVDRLRVTSNTGQNLRINVDTGAVTVDGAINGETTSISGSAYSNNVAGATTTTLYDIGTVTDKLYMQTPPNNGTLIAVGSLGFDASGVTGFDISGATGVAYAALTNSDTGKSGLYTINLATGTATLTGSFGMGGNSAIAPPLLGLTVSAVPEPQTYALMLAGLAAVGFLAKRRGQA